MMKKIIIFTVLIIVVLVTGFVLFAPHSNQRDANEQQATNDSILYYTCGMHPSVRISPEEYDKGTVNCPICNMKLIPVYSTEGVGEQKQENKGVVSRVNIKSVQAQRAGVKTEFAKRLRLFKEIRTVGRVAYDPELAIAQEEFISSLKALKKIQRGNIPEIKERAVSLVESSKRKLRLLGLSIEQIEELERKKKVQTNLILPEEKMWIYGNAYEYELPWVKIGARVKVTTSSLPGEEFHGVISSINPVLDPKTRSITFRAEVDNHHLQLKPEMYVDVIITSVYLNRQGEHMVLAIPKDAVLNTGVRKIAWVYKGAGAYEGREVVIGPEATAVVNGENIKLYPILEGLVEGESVVTKANFLIDSQSQLSGVVASVYGGALGAEEKKTPAAHQH